jgi:hypothetical protein
MPLGALRVRLGLTAPMGKRGQSGRRYPRPLQPCLGHKNIQHMVRYGGWMAGYVGGLDATWGALSTTATGAFWSARRTARRA